MKKIIYLMVLLTGLILLSGLFWVQASQATTYATGSLLKAESGQGVYYLASDGKRYLFPNPQTYFSWYHSLANIEIIPASEMHKLPQANKPITMAPARRLLQFGSNPRVYAVGAGAILHWINSGETAEKNFGKDWQKLIINLPATRLQYYSVGEIISKATPFNSPTELGLARTINQELKTRGDISSAVSKIDYQTNSGNIPLLTSLKENLRANFSPRFTPELNVYTLNAEQYEEKLTLTPKFATNLKIKINNIDVLSDQPLTLQLDEGPNYITVEVMASNGNKTTYEIKVVRRAKAEDNYLKSLTENLSNNLDPAFKAKIFNYELKANNDEELLKLKPIVNERHASIKINNLPVQSGKEFSIYLQPGTNTVAIRVYAENGHSRTYLLDVYRSPWKTGYTLDLISLKTNLRNKLKPSFNPAITSYKLQAKSYENTATISVKPRSQLSVVKINNEIALSKKMDLGSGNNLIIINVAEPNTNRSKSYILYIEKP